MGNGRLLTWRLAKRLGLSLALSLAACDSGGAGPDGGGGRGSADAGGADSGSAREGGPTQTDAGMDGCPEPSDTGTTHGPTLSGDATWTAADGPHELPDGLTIARGAQLTLEACAVVRVGPGQDVTVNGSLLAQGEAGRPVRFERLQADAAWGALVAVRVPSPLSLAHTVLAGGGGLPDGAASEQYGVIRLEASADAELSEMLAVDTVTIDGSDSNGVSLRSNAAFSTGSQRLTIAGAAQAPIVTDGWAASSVPDGDYTGNGVDAVLVLTSDRIGIDGLTVQASWRARGVPYRIGGETDSAPKLLRVGAPMGMAQAQLTLQAGVELDFSAGSGLLVSGAQASLDATGTAAAPVVLTSAATDKAAGDWLGVRFDKVVSPDSVIAHAQILYAGNPDTETRGYSCGTPKAEPSQVDQTMGAISFSLDEAPKASFISDTQIRASASNGIDRGWTGEAIDMAAGNELSEIAFCTQTDPRPEMGMCDDPPACPSAD